MICETVLMVAIATILGRNFFPPMVAIFSLGSMTNVTNDSVIFREGEY